MGAFYTIFDVGNSQIGLATAVGSKSTITVGMPPTEPPVQTTTAPNNNSNPIIEFIMKIITNILNFLKSILSHIGL